METDTDLMRLAEIPKSVATFAKKPFVKKSFNPMWKVIVRATTGNVL